MCSQSPQEHSQVVLRAPEVMEVHSGCYEIAYLVSQILQLLRPLHKSAEDQESS